VPLSVRWGLLGLAESARSDPPEWREAFRWMALLARVPRGPRLLVEVFLQAYPVEQLRGESQWQLPLPERKRCDGGEKQLRAL
jgi:hypothetical protein